MIRRTYGCRSFLPIDSSRWKRLKKAGSLSNCMKGILIATVSPVFWSMALKIDAMPLRLTSSVILEPVVQRLADIHFVTHGLGNLAVDGQSAIDHHFFDAVDADDLHGKIILGAPLFGQGQELFAGLVRRGVRDDLAESRPRS